MIYFYRALIFTLFISMFSCKSVSKQDWESISLADKNASTEAKELYVRIKEIAEEGIAFGHQDATAYGIGWEHQPNFSNLKSDIKEVTGKFPAVHGYDVGHIELDNVMNLDSVPFSVMKDHIQKNA